MHPSVTGFSFFGVLIIYLFAQGMLGGSEINTIDRRTFVETIVDVFLNGVAPDNSPVQPPASLPAD